MFDRRGNLLNKCSVLEHLLHKVTYDNFGHIKKLKDVKEVSTDSVKEGDQLEIVCCIS